ncbi:MULTISPECIES: DUF6807 family protein [Microbacterium]|uniref:DUF6807 family protein n=1 Tax=Microbacterium TaxID=33882 RepID=UPI000D6534D8|nr:MULTISPECIES: DUF6807 family protein [Microbacterium]
MTARLLGAGAAAVTQQSGVDLPRTFSPRPFLTATTPSGAPVTQVSPGDHLHHLGASLALPDVDGTSFWGGRTYRRAHGSVMLDNHGVQVVREQEASSGRLWQRIAWLDGGGRQLLDETRRIAAREEDGRWEVVWTSCLRAASAAVSFGSPQTNGREGAFYGGIFWRTPFPRARVWTADGDGVDASHGSRSPWLAIQSQTASLVAATTTAMPWFVRNEGYVGFLPAVAVTERRLLVPGETLQLDLAVSISDEPQQDPDAVASGLLDRLREGATQGAEVVA